MKKFTCTKFLNISRNSFCDYFKDSRPPFSTTGSNESEKKESEGLGQKLSNKVNNLSDGIKGGAEAVGLRESEQKRATESKKNIEDFEHKQKEMSSHSMGYGEAINEKLDEAKGMMRQRSGKSHGTVDKKEIERARRTVGLTKEKTNGFSKKIRPDKSEGKGLGDKMKDTLSNTAEKVGIKGVGDNIASKANKLYEEAKDQLKSKVVGSHGKSSKAKNEDTSASNQQDEPLNKRAKDSFGKSQTFRGSSHDSYQKARSDFPSETKFNKSRAGNFKEPGDPQDLFGSAKTTDRMEHETGDSMLKNAKDTKKSGNYKLSDSSTSKDDKI